ncbi:flagellar assembly protein FliW [Shouchella miscanthi]|uniref:Flagellar assembly factor FliW n=1 Tax=Shouchella miscanthi TaxID=2598861 RepID=A0ABU6NNB8_9BACI|nr:flagellar assembly protein FliW [Shouchella miscanthi]MED4129034.1 flagellar assembly protein FliW [Shouchella miscanthi]
MQLETNYLGTIEVEDGNKLHFSLGIPGFPEEKEFVLLPFPESDFYLLQSIAQKHVAFVCLNPFSIWKNYHIDLDANTIQLLEVAQPTDVALFVIITIQQPFSQSTANLNAPIIINTRNNKGKQLVQEGQTYSSKALLSTKEGA